VIDSVGQPGFVRTWVVLLAVFALLFGWGVASAQTDGEPLAVDALAVGGEPMMSASSGRHAWFVAPGPMDELALYHVELPVEEQATARVATALAEMPIAMAAGGDGLVLVFGPASAEQGDGGGADDGGGATGGVLRVRSTRAVEFRPGLFGFSELRPMPPLAAADEPPALMPLGEMVFALHDGGLLVAEGAAWHPLDLPDAAVLTGDGHRSLRMTPDKAGSVRLAHVAADGALRLWSGALEVSVIVNNAGGPSPGTDLSEGTGEGEPVGDDASASGATPDRPYATPRSRELRIEWSDVTETRWGAADEGASRVGLIAAGDALLAVVWAGDGGPVSVRRVRSEGPVEAASLAGVPPSAGLSVSGDAPVFLWNAGRGPGEPVEGRDENTDASEAGGVARMLIVGAGGSTRFDGPVTVAQPIGQHQLQAVVLLLASIMLTVMLYVARRDAGERGAVSLPEAWVIAEPSRRLLAGLIDAMLAYVVVGLAYGDPVRWLTENVIVLISEEGATPIMLWVIALGAHTAATEVVFATTIGKRLTRLRTVTSRGGKPDAKTAITRSFARAACPFAAVLLLMEPHRPHPASLGTFSVMRRIDRPGDGDGGADRHGGRGGRGGGGTDGPDRSEQEENDR
jgi:uncharacterized RDD family membrane protein YckC